MPLTLDEEDGELVRYKNIMANIWKLMYPDSDPPPDPFDTYAHLETILKDKDGQISRLSDEANNAASFLEEVIALRKYKEEHP